MEEDNTDKKKRREKGNGKAVWHLARTAIES
jgi:hypothetical protein